MQYKRVLLVFIAVIMAICLVATPAMAAAVFVKNPAYPVVVPVNPWEAHGVGAACVIWDVDEDMYKMWYSGLSGSGVPAIGYASSIDGIIWNKTPTAVVNGQTDDWDNWGVGAPSVRKEGLNSYKMWYTGINDSFQPSIGYATSSDGTFWENEQWVWSGTQAWEASGVSLPSVVWDEGTSTYRMWYSAHESSIIPSAIGYATSHNGTDWTSGSATPVLLPTPATWDSAGVFGCCVNKTSTGYLMYYSGYNGVGGTNPRIGEAESSNGTTWYKSADPVINSGTGWEAKGVAAPSFIYKNDGSIELWYTGGAANAAFNGGYSIGRATKARDMVHMPSNSTAGTAILIAGLAGVIGVISYRSLRRNRFLVK